MKVEDIDFNQAESHADSAIAGLRLIQNAGKYPKKACSASMYGANILQSQKYIISSMRESIEQQNKRISELEIALHKAGKWLTADSHFNLSELDCEISELLQNTESVN